ncbi:hypothetical protein ACI65C_009361 [Semiaphis heraclei]
MLNTEGVGTTIVFLGLVVLIVLLECHQIEKEKDRILQEELMYTNQNFEMAESIYTAEEPQSTIISRLLSMSLFENTDVSRGRPSMWWSIFPFTSNLQLGTIYSFHQNNAKRFGYEYSDVVKNTEEYASRILPPVYPLKCCALHNHRLPPMKILYNNIFKRAPGKFIPDRQNKNLLFNAFHQYFILQFFDADSKLTVTASQLYGSDAVSERSMRSFSGGQLKTLKFNCDHYAPNQAFTLRSNLYLDAWSKSLSNDGSPLSRLIARKIKGVNMLSASPMLFVIASLWVREHNRVCEELSRKSPTWTDEELYTMARNIVTGQMMNIMMNEILNVELKPEVYHHRMEYTRNSGTPIELYLITALSSLPDKLQYNSTRLKPFGNIKQVLEAGLGDSLEFMVNTKIGMAAAHNDGELTESQTKTLITLSREHCLQGFNSYRRRLGLPTYSSLYELTGNSETALGLLRMYGTVENVELLTGMMTEKPSAGDALPTAEVMTNSFIINAILSNNLTTQQSWIPDTFGGVEFFNLVKSSSLMSLLNCIIMDRKRLSGAGYRTKAKEKAKKQAEVLTKTKTLQNYFSVPLPTSTTGKRLATDSAVLENHDESNIILPTDDPVPVDGEYEVINNENRCVQQIRVLEVLENHDGSNIILPTDDPVPVDGEYEVINNENRCVQQIHGLEVLENLDESNIVLPTDDPVSVIDVECEAINNENRCLQQIHSPAVSVNSSDNIVDQFKAPR